MHTELDQPFVREHYQLFDHVLTDSALGSVYMTRDVCTVAILLEPTLFHMAHARHVRSLVLALVDLRKCWHSG